MDVIAVHCATVQGSQLSACRQNAPSLHHLLRLQCSGSEPCGQEPFNVASIHSTPTHFLFPPSVLGNRAAWGAYVWTWGVKRRLLLSSCKKPENEWNIFSTSFWSFLVSTRWQWNCSVLCLVTQLCPILCNPMDYSPPRFLCPWGFSRQEYWSGMSCPQWQWSYILRYLALQRYTFTTLEFNIMLLTFVESIWFTDTCCYLPLKWWTSSGILAPPQTHRIGIPSLTRSLSDLSAH